MADKPEEKIERRQRLDEVRAKIEQDMASGSTLEPALWKRRYPDLEPELDAILDELMGGRSTNLMDDATVGLPQPDETVPLVHGPGESTSPGTRAVSLSASDQPATLPDARPSETGATVEYTPVPPAAAGVGPDDRTVAQPSSRRGESERQARAGARAGPGARPDRTELPAGQKVRYIGDYETVSVLGQGGMGIVYKARQISLNRLVALKMIRNAEFAGQDQVRRFQNEAEAVATLDHPGIVPIYEVGEFEDQRYFSMKLVEGEGLDKKLKQLAADPRAATLVVAEVAEAVYHAHMRGILHRDLKPANILIDGRGHPHVTDFGLAKRIEEDAGLTVSGSIMGTPAYMAPEQAAGRTSQITTASDVYGLGAILYATLTGKAPFAGDSVMDTLEKVRHTPPERPRRINVKLPADLEVICLKCLEKDPRHRYPSAQALADDLNRWRDGEPISARPVSRAVRAWMWCKRKPAMAGLSAALVVALIGGVIGIAWQWREALYQRDQARASRNQALIQESAARKAEAQARSARDAAVTSEKAAVASEKAAVAARAQAEQNALLAAQQATLALGTIQEMIVQVRTRLVEPGLYDIKMALLNLALNRVDAVASVYDKSTSKEATVLVTLNLLAQIYRELGQSEKAYKLLEQCLAIAKERVKIKEGSDPSRQNLANVNRDMATIVEEHRRDMKAALAFNEESLRIWNDVYLHPKVDPYTISKKIVKYFLAEAYSRVAISHYRMGEVASARDDFRKAYNLRSELVAENPDNPDMKQDLSYSTMALAETSFRLGDVIQADEYYRQTLEQREAMFQAKPKDARVNEQLGAVSYMIGEFKLKTRDHALARRHLERSRELRAALAEADERNVLKARDLGLTLYRLGNLADREKDEKAATETFEAARKIQQKLADTDAQNDKRLIELMPTLAHVGQVDKAAEIADRLSAGPNLDNELRLQIARCYAQCARKTPPPQAERSQAFQVKAVESLRTAVANGFRDRVYVETEPDLDPLRDREDFKALSAKLGLTNREAVPKGGIGS